MLAITPGTENMTKVENFLMNRESPTFTAYYNGKMSYKLAGQDWEEYIVQAFPELKNQHTSENIFKTVVDLYAENLVPVFPELKGFSNLLMPLLTRGEALALVDPSGTAHYPEHFEMMSDGTFTIAAIFTRSLQSMQDFITFAYSDGRTRLFRKPLPDDFKSSDRTGYEFVEEISGNELFRFALDDKGFGATLAALQDRVNHSIIDQTVVAEANVRPFWYLLNVDLPVQNPYLPAQVQQDTGGMSEQKSVKGAGGRIFTTSSEGPFGQLTPPDMSSMVSYHDSLVDKVPMNTGIPAHYFKPGEGTPPTGVALKVLSKRFNNRISRIREDIYDTLEALATTLGIEKNADADPADGSDPNEKEYDFWPGNDDLLQESLDAHGINLSQMGYPLEYIASVVTPGVDLDDYEEEGGLPADGDPSQPTDMTAMGQTGLPATPGQIASYAQNPGQRAKG